MQKEITNTASLEALVLELGFLPFFRNDIAGFSVEEHTPLALWFPEDKGTEGPWEWKGPVVRGGRCAYGKLYRGGAGYVSLEWLPELVNYRRDGESFAEKYAAGRAGRKEKQLYETIARRGSVLTRSLKAECDYRKGGQKGFDGAIARLQMQTYVCVADFEYMLDKTGRLYGWGMARYATPEALYGEETVTAAYGRTAEDSKQRMLAHLRARLPQADEKRLERLLRG